MRADPQVADMYNNEYYLGAYQTTAKPGVWRTGKWREPHALADGEEVTQQRLWERRVLLLVPVPHETDWARDAAAAAAAAPTAVVTGARALTAIARACGQCARDTCCSRRMSLRRPTAEHGHARESQVRWSLFA
jgi:hypothetical protein